MLGYIGIFIGFFMLGCVVIATWLHLPKGKSSQFQVKVAANLTKGLRGGIGGKVFYWATPVLVFIFFSALGGVALFAACLVGAFAFLPRYEAALLSVETRASGA